MAKENEVQKGELIQEIPLKEIHVDHAWNARGSAYLLQSAECGPDQSFGGDESTRGLSGLIDSIKARRTDAITHGQDTPVLVRPNPKGKGQPYSLVAGFRRFEAIRRIAAEEGDRAAIIRAVVRTMTEAEARAANMRENVVRDNLARQDVAWGVHDLTVRCGMSVSGAAQELNITQGYASKLHSIMTKVTGSVDVDGQDESGKKVKKRIPITQAWRESVTPKSVDQMVKISGMSDPVEQSKAFEEEKKKAKSGPGSIDKKVERAYEMGLILGLLQFHGHLDAKGIRFDGPVIRFLVPGLKEDLKARDLDKIIDAARQGFADGKRGPEKKERESNKDVAAAE